MKKIISLRQTDRPVREKHKSSNFGRKDSTFFGPKTWNSIPYHIKSTENITSFKTMIKF